MLAHTHGFPGVHSFGWEGEMKARGWGGGGGEGWETRAPHLHPPGRGSILKAALSLSGGTGGVEGSGPAGQRGELHVTQLSMTTREGAPENTEQLSCGRSALGWSAAPEQSSQ